MQNLISTASSLKLSLKECFIHTNCLVILSATLFIFVVDLNLPLGVAAGTPYVLVVFASLWVSGASSSYLIAALGIVFTIIGFFLSPGIATSLHIVLINRALTLLLIACATVMVIKIKKANIDISALMNKMLIDLITGFKNKQAFENELNGEIQRCKRYGHPLSVAVIDVDFQNDYKSEQQEIKKIAQEVKANIRTTDFPYSLETNTLAIIFPETNLSESKSVCEIIHKNIIAKQDKSSIDRMAISIGIAALDKPDNDSTLFERAKNALTIAKSNEAGSVSTLPHVASKDKSAVAAILLRSRSN